MWRFSMSIDQDELVGLELDQAKLAQLDLDIAEGERRVAAQARLIEELAQTGQETMAAQELLQAMRDDLKDLRSHQDLIRKLPSIPTEDSETLARPLPF
ncbi:hypothetical protein AA309_21240 [Microvirga vignae]|uniref:Uncharacterized protein n=2 Tax=Microvirga vignae TaxID=1225564 RepID=A0A0H1R7Q7_9HYPH|nr:hypothetical protein AA309_21240 [Microvirga vignae]